MNHLIEALNSTHGARDVSSPSYNGVPVVYDTSNEKEMDKTYQRYQLAADDVKKHLDNLSMFFFGEDNTERYFRLKGKFKKNHNAVINLDESDEEPYHYIDMESNITLEGFFSELEIMQADFDDKPVQTGFIDNNVNRWNSLCVINGKQYREKVETLIVKGSSVYLAFIDDNRYSIPGGSSEPNKTLSEQAASECKEEARIIIDNIKYFTTYDYNYTAEELRKQPRYMRSVPEDKRWIGKHIHLFVADFVGEYKGYVEKQDRDYLFTRNGKFYDIKKIFKKLRPEHQLALKEFIIRDGEKNE